MFQRLLDLLQSHLLAVTTIVPAVSLATWWAYSVVLPGQNVGIWDVAGVVAASALGFMVGAYTLYQIVWRLLLATRKARGLSIKSGSRVRILCGPHRNKMTTVYQTWDSRGQVRVDLGLDPSKQVEDVYMSYQLEPQQD